MGSFNAIYSGGGDAMKKISEQNKGAFLGRKRGNKLVAAVNALRNMRVEVADENKAPEVLISDSNTVIKVPGGVNGFEEKIFWVVDTGNVPKRYIFLVKEL